MLPSSGSKRRSAELPDRLLELLFGGVGVALGGAEVQVSCELPDRGGSYAGPEQRRDEVVPQAVELPPGELSDASDAQGRGAAERNPSWP